MNQSAQKQETELLSTIFSLLEVTYSCNETDKIKIAQEQLQQMSTNLSVFIPLLIKSLYLSSINGNPISLDLHKSVVIYLRNILLKNASQLKPDEILEFLKKIISLFFAWEKNNNLNNETISTILQNIISFLLSIEIIYKEPRIIENLFSEIIKFISDSNSSYMKDPTIFITYEKIICLCNSLLTSRSTNSNNYQNLLSNFFLPLIDKILAMAQNYIIPEKNVFNDKYCLIVKILFDTFYNVLSNIKSFLSNDLIKTVFINIFKKYWIICFELIKLNPPLDEPSKKKFEKINPVIVFNVEEKKYNSINLMKSRIVQLICFLIQYMSSISNDFDFLSDKEDDSITDKEIISYITEMILLTVECFKDILSNKEKYYLVRNYELEVFNHENSINILLYELCVFLTRTLIRKPFKDNYRNEIKLFLLNILFPIFSTNDTEKKSIENDYEMYHLYINDIIEDFKMKNFRTAGMFLITKICNFFRDENNFVLSFTLEMFNYVINEQKINNELNYNVYLENKDKFMIDKLDNEAKVDFFLLLILLLKHQINKNNLIKNRLKKLLIDNQSKLHLIQSLTIKIKLCLVYSTFIPILFREEQNQAISQRNLMTTNYNFNSTNGSGKDSIINNNNNNNKICDNSENCNCTISKEYYTFIQNSIDFLLKCIAQNISINNNKIDNNNNYFYSLSQAAADSISDLIISFKNKNEDDDDEDLKMSKLQDNKENQENIITKKNNNDYAMVNNYISKSLSNNFKIVIHLILIIDNPSFYNLIDYLVEYIKAEERQDIFVCLNNITQKFVNDFDKNKQQDNIININMSKPFIMQYFKILSDFLKGVNKLNKNDQKEIDLFEDILNKIFTRVNINDLDKFEYYDEVIETFEDYINLVEFVNEKSIQIFNKIIPIMKKDSIFNNSYFSFLCTLMKFIPKSNNISSNDKVKLTDEIIQIIKISFSFSEDLCLQSIKNALLLTMKLFNVGINSLSYDILKELIIISLNSFTPITKDDLYFGNISDKTTIDQLILSSISLGFIFRPIDTYKIIFEHKEPTTVSAPSHASNKEGTNSGNPNNTNSNKENANPYITKYFNLLLVDIGISNNDYIILLNKCVILGLCSIFKEKYCVEKINGNKNMKFLLLQIFVKLVEKHKKEQVEQLNKLMKKETNCNFIEDNENEDDEEDDDDDEDEEMEEIKDIVHDILHENENIKNADEYKYFCNIINDLKQNENNSYKILSDHLKGRLEELLLLRNISINYKGKQLMVPRKTVKILKSK